MGNRFSVWALCVLASGCTLGGATNSWEASGIRGVWANVGNGSVLASSEARDTVLVEWEGGGLGKPGRPEITETEDGWLEVDADGLLGGGELTILTPLGLTIEAFVDRGDIELDLAAPADITACVGAGSVRVELPPGPYELSLDGAVGAIDSSVVDTPGAEYHIQACVAAGDITVSGG